MRLTLALERVELVEERGDVDNDTRADESLNLGVNQTRRKEVEGVGGLLALLILNDDGVAGVVTAGAAGADICVRRKDVDKFALALIAPLGSEAGCQRLHAGPRVVTAEPMNVRPGKYSQRIQVTVRTPMVPSRNLALDPL